MTEYRTRRAITSTVWIVGKAKLLSNGRNREEWEHGCTGILIWKLLVYVFEVARRGNKGQPWILHPFKIFLRNKNSMKVLWESQSWENFHQRTWGPVNSKRDSAEQRPQQLAQKATYTNEERGDNEDYRHKHVRSCLH